MSTTLSLRARLLILIALVTALMAGTGLVTLVQLRGVAQSVDSLYKDRLLPAEQLRRISDAFGREVPAALSHLRDGRIALPLARQQFDNADATARRYWADYLQTELVDAERRLIGRAKPALERGHAAIARLRELSKVGRLEAFDAAVNSQYQADTEALAGVLAELIDVQLQVARREADESARTFRKAVWSVSILVLLTAGLGLVLAWSVLQSHQEQQSHAQASQARLQRFYMALSTTNQLIVREFGSAQHLYDELCRICVETGHARLATVVLFENGQYERVASFGPADRLMPGAPRSWREDSPFAQGSLTSQAIREGRHAISNRAIAESRAAAGGVIPPGVEAMAAFPLRRDGQVIGALSLLAGELDFFDTAMLALLDEMAGDVSFALDNLARKQVLQDSLAKAQAERALFELLFNTSSVSAALVRIADGTLMEINEQLCSYYGYSRAELLGRRPGDLGVGMVEADRHRLYGQIKSEGKVRNMEITLRSRDGRQRRLLVSGDLIDYHGEACALASAVDITELQNLQQGQQSQQQ